jgi:hypothetical protein
VKEEKVEDLTQRGCCNQLPLVDEIGLHFSIHETCEGQIPNNDFCTQEEDYMAELRCGRRSLLPIS